MKKHKIVVLHDDDLDGMGAAYATWWWMQHSNWELDFFSTSHYGASRKIVPQLPHNTGELIVLDWTYPPEQLFNLHVPVTAIDHHQYGFDAFLEFYKATENTKWLVEYEWGTIHIIITDKGHTFRWIYASDHSAATLAWNYWKHYVPIDERDEPIPPILLHIEDRDLWKWNLDYTDEYTIALESYIHEHGFKALRNLEPIESKGIYKDYVGPVYPYLQEDGSAMSSYRQMIAEQQAATFAAQERIKDGIPYGLANLSHTISETHHAALALHPEWAFTMSYFITGDENVIFNLRSRKKGLLYDVGKLAKSLGGGGHFSSAGFPISLKEFAGLKI